MRLDIQKGELRKMFSILAATAALGFGLITVAVPMVMAAAPAIFTVAFAVLAFFVWPRGLNRPGPDPVEAAAVQKQVGL